MLTSAPAGSPPLRARYSAVSPFCRYRHSESQQPGFVSGFRLLPSQRTFQVTPPRSGQAKNQSGHRRPRPRHTHGSGAGEFVEGKPGGFPSTSHPLPQRCGFSVGSHETHASPRSFQVSRLQTLLPQRCHSRQAQAVLAKAVEPSACFSRNFDLRSCQAWCRMWA